MSFQPVVPLTGFVGWRFLQRTLDAQQAAFRESDPIQRDTDYFIDNIATVRTAQDLVADRRLLAVALGAFGLDGDINNTFYVQKVLEDGTTNPEALSNRLTDKRYRAFANTFGLGIGALPLTGLAAFATEITDRYEEKQFGRAVGDSNSDMRLALNVEGSLQDIVTQNATNTGQWFSILGDAPLRSVFETALGLPPSIGRIDLDQQLTAFKERAKAVFGSDEPSDIANAEKRDDLIRLFLIRSESAQFAANSGSSIALTLLQSSAFATAL